MILFKFRKEQQESGRRETSSSTTINGIQTALLSRDLRRNNELILFLRSNEVPCRCENEARLLCVPSQYLLCHITSVSYPIAFSPCPIASA